MAYFQTKNPYLGKFWRALEWKMLVQFMAIWNTLMSLDISYGHLVYFPRFGILCQEKSGKPEGENENFALFIELPLSKLSFKFPCTG
jgi:hypothetical protein